MWWLSLLVPVPPLMVWLGIWLMEKWENRNAVIRLLVSERNRAFYRRNKYCAAGLEANKQ